MVKLPFPAKILTDTAARPTRLHLKPQYAVTAAVVGLGELRKKAAKPDRMVAAIGPTKAKQRVEIHNLKLSETNPGDGTSFISAQFNPTEFTEEVKVKWNALTIPGMSHDKLLYSSTGNLTLDLDFKFSALEWIENGKIDYEHSTTKRKIVGHEALVKARNFLHSLCYSKGDAQIVAEAAPPRVLIYWPNLLSIVCVVESLKIKHEKFDNNLNPQQFVATLRLTEIRDRRLSTDDVLKGGSYRNNDTPRGKPFGEFE